MSRKQRETTPGVTLTDTGPLVALFDADDKFHVQAEQALARLPRRPLLTTWPCLTESMYLLHESIGYAAQEKLWEWVADGLLQLHPSSEGEWRRMRGLMAQYEDSPMDLADASLVAAAEERTQSAPRLCFSGYWQRRQVIPQAVVDSTPLRSARAL